MIYDCAIIGAGPAGIISAIHLTRSGFTVALFEKKNVGGLLRNAYRIDNYLGLPGASGKELIALFEKQLSSFGIKPIRAEVSAITRKSTFDIQTNDTCHHAHSVIIATGTTHKKLNVPGEDKCCGQRLFYEPADLPSMSHKDIVIVGGGDAAFDYALSLHRMGNNPSILMRSNPTCLNVLLNAVREKRIPYVEHSAPLRFYEDCGKIAVESIHKTFKADFVLVAVGRAAVHPRLELEDANGLFFSGDVKNGAHRQVHIATGDGLHTAMSVQEYLEHARHTH
ncbi:MAG TPA: NAD(P)/FAD-dependent oxidoreductase [Candidatus Nanoarchaeia archaeon]|nr:NAD(P)/FAD-dependent oxidoreductase [Candidatus Nanoarchaeia archaeon]